MTLAAWALKVMLAIQPASITPWANTYETTAQAFVDEAEQYPLFAGNTGIAKTVSLFLSVAWFEGRFDPQAKGDCRTKVNGTCVDQPQSLCMFQIGRSNLAALNLSEKDLLSDVRVCTHAARTMMKTSFTVCRGYPTLDLLGHYASGGNTCGGLKESRHRMNKAEWIFNQKRELQ